MKPHCLHMHCQGARLFEKRVIWLAFLVEPAQIFLYKGSVLTQYTPRGEPHAAEFIHSPHGEGTLGTPN